MYHLSILDIIAGIGFSTAVISIIPQIVQLYKTKSSKDLSMAMLLNLTIASLCWMIYSIMTKDFPLFLTNFLLTIGNIVMVALKLKYRA